MVIGEIIGAKSTLDDNFYRGRVLKKNDDSTYSVQYIDFGDKDNVSLSNIFELPQDLMVINQFLSIIYYNQQILKLFTLYFIF